MKGIVVAALVALVSGCAYTPQTVELAPSVAVTASDVGRNVTLNLVVYDERTEREIGHRGSAMMKGAAITTDGDVAAVVQSSLTDMLVQKGFEVASYGDTGHVPTLRVDIRGLNYSTSTGFWTGGVQVTAAMKATATGELESYENFYRYDEEERVVVVPGADSNSERINAGLTDVLQKMMSDNKLLEVLAGR